MRIFLIKTTCFILGIWLLSYSLGSLVEQVAPMNVYSKSEADKLNKLLENKDRIEAISLGNSHSGAIDFASLGMEGQVLARAGTDLFEVNLYANQVVPQLPDLQTVFISVSYFSFTNNNVLLDDKRNLRIELYGMLNTWKPLAGDFEPLVLGKLHRYFRIMSIVRPDSWKNVFNNILQSKMGAESPPATTVTTKTVWGECGHFTKGELEAIGNDIAAKAANTHLRFLEASSNTPRQSYQILAKTIEMLQSRGIRVVLFTPPYYQAYNNRFKAVAPEMVESMEVSMKEIQRQYDVEYYNAASLAAFSTHPELFYNSDHLNPCGMRAFSEYLRTEMEAR
jgi:hypothetical protein